MPGRLGTLGTCHGQPAMTNGNRTSAIPSMGFDISIYIYMYTQYFMEFYKCIQQDLNGFYWDLEGI